MRIADVKPGLEVKLLCGQCGNNCFGNGLITVVRGILTGEMRLVGLYRATAAFWFQESNPYGQKLCRVSYMRLTGHKSNMRERYKMRIPLDREMYDLMTAKADLSDEMFIKWLRERLKLDKPTVKKIKINKKPRDIML